MQMMQRSQSGQVATHVTSLMRSMSRGLPSLTRISPNPLLETPHPDSQLPPGPRPVRIAVEAEYAAATTLHCTSACAFMSRACSACESLCAIHPGHDAYSLHGETHGRVHDTTILQSSQRIVLI